MICHKENNKYLIWEEEKYVSIFFVMIRSIFCKEWSDKEMENLVPTPDKKLTILTFVVSKKQVFLWVVNM